MIQWIGLAFVMAAIVVAAHWYRTRTDSLGRTKGFPWVWCAILLLLAVGLLQFWVLDIRLESRLSKAASEIAGKSVKVECQNFGQATVDTGQEFGYVRFTADGVPETRTLIKRDQCKDISDYLKSDKNNPDRNTIVAVHVLTHETMHMSGITDEGKTDCLAMQKDTSMARLLGASQQAARQLAVDYYETVYPSMPSPYKSDQCGPGLPYDENLPDAPWKTISVKTS